MVNRLRGCYDDGRGHRETSTVDAHFGHEFPHRASADDGGVGVVGKTNVALSRLNFEVGLCGAGIECTIELRIVGHPGSCERRQGRPTANLSTRKREMHVDVAAVDFEQLFLAGFHRRFVDVDEELFAVYLDAAGRCLREVVLFEIVSEPEEAGM